MKSDRLKQLKTVSIHGKNYVMVDQRLIHCAEHYDYNVKIKEVKYFADIKTWLTEVAVEIKWSKDQEHYNVYEGIAQETIGQGMINKTSALENCYTSAVGKALASAGIGVITGNDSSSTASGDEMQKAKTSSEEIDKTFNLVLQHLDEYKSKYSFLEFEERMHKRNAGFSADQMKQLSDLWNKPKTAA